MPGAPPVILLAALLAGGCALAPPRQVPPIEISDVRSSAFPEILLAALVRDADGRLVADLAPAEFHVERASSGHLDRGLAIASVTTPSPGR